jgi:hypothetical protein
MVGKVGIPVVGSGGHMADRRRKLVAGLAALIAFSLVVCPLGWGAAGAPARAAAQGTPWDIPTIVGTPIVVPTPIPTVGPGQYFEEGDPALPQAGQRHGNNRFGWATIPGQPGLVLVWVTDDEGTHYVVLDSGSDLFLGSLDSVTNTRREDGVEDYILQREELQRQRLATAGEGMGMGAALGVLAWGIGLCPVTGGGGCVAGVVGAGAVFAANAVRNFVVLQGQNADLRELDANLLAAFDEAVP